MKRKLILPLAALLAISCITLAAFAQTSPQSPQSADTSPAIDSVITGFIARQEAAAQEHWYSHCPGCGLTTLRVSQEDYDSVEADYVSNCRHGGFPFLNDTEVVRSGTRVYLCDCCGFTAQETVTDEHIRYCPFMESAY